MHFTVAGVYWLDFFEQLLDFKGTDLITATNAAGAGTGAPGVTLKTEFSLDGTHLNPSYLRLVELALNKLPAFRNGK